MPMVVKLVLMLLFHFIVTKMKEDTVNSNAMYMVEIKKICMPVEMICLYVYFKIYLTTNYLQLQLINRFKYGKIEIHH